jgi:hypothetical protein
MRILAEELMIASLQKQIEQKSTNLRQRCCFPTHNGIMVEKEYLTENNNCHQSKTI